MNISTVMITNNTMVGYQYLGTCTHSIDALRLGQTYLNRENARSNHTTEPKYKIIYDSLDTLNDYKLERVGNINDFVSNQDRLIIDTVETITRPSGMFIDEKTTNRK
jgi:hypothetical protein